MDIEQPPRPNVFFFFSLKKHTQDHSTSWKCAAKSTIVPALFHCTVSVHSTLHLHLVDQPTLPVGLSILSKTSKNLADVFYWVFRCTNQTQKISARYLNSFKIQFVIEIMMGNNKKRAQKQNVLEKAFSDGRSAILRPLFNTTVPKVSIIKWSQNLIWANKKWCFWHTQRLKKKLCKEGNFNICKWKLK